MSESESPSNDNENETTTLKRKRGRPFTILLEPFKDTILELFYEEVPIIDITRRLNLEHGLDISERTVFRRLIAWKVPPRQKVSYPDDLRERIAFHYNKNLNDEQIAAQLKEEGYGEIRPRILARVRRESGLRRRSRFPEFKEFSDDDGEAPGEQVAAGDGTLAPISAQSKKKAKKGSLKSHDQALIPKVTVFVQDYMKKYDGSHDFNHIRRVVGLAHLLYTEINKGADALPKSDNFISLDLHVITLAALLHDVGDKKYLEEGVDGSTLVLATLLRFGATEDLAIKVQRIVLGVSYSSEIKDPAIVAGLIEKYPELAVVQDADRLDAIGAVGIGRTFTFGGAKGAREMGDTIKHFGEKLERLEGMMKTVPGKKLARERTERLKIFKDWWTEEQKEAEGLLRKK